MFRTRNNILSIACVVATAALLESANAISYTFEIAVENAHDIIGPVISRIKFDGEIPSESDLTSYYTTNLREGDIKNMFDSSIEDGNYIAWNKPIPVGTQLFTIEAESPVSEIEIVNWRPTYAPGWRILEDGIEVFKATSNEGDAGTPSPATYTYTLERDSPPPSPPPACLLYTSPSPRD